jgi:hypothetical protein
MKYFKFFGTFQMSEVCGTLGRWNTVLRTIEQKLINFFKQFVCHTCSQHDSNLKVKTTFFNTKQDEAADFETTWKNQRFEDFGGRRRGMDDANARPLKRKLTMVAPQPQLTIVPGFCKQKKMKLISGLLQHQLFKV